MKIKRTFSKRTDDSKHHNEYVVRFNKNGEIIGESLDQSLGLSLGIVVDRNKDKNIFCYLKKLNSLNDELPTQLENHIKNLIKQDQSFSFHGDCIINNEEYHIHVYGHAVCDFSGDNIYALSFMDETRLTRLRRVYELLFRLANHELKSPLACISGAAEFCETHITKYNPEGIRTCLDMIIRNVAAMEEMITRYLNISRIESGNFTLDPREVYFSQDILDPLFAELQPALLAKEMTISYKSQDDKEQIFLADPEALQIVLRNLLSNSIKYGKEKTEIIVSVETFPDFVQISVENIGHGLNPKESEIIFGKFVRLDMMHASRGTGLGLYLTRKLVELWHGAIRVESERDRVKFAFTIPQ